MSVLLEGEPLGLDLELPAHVPLADWLPEVAMLFGQCAESVGPKMPADPTTTLWEAGIRDGQTILLHKKDRTIDTSTP